MTVSTGYEQLLGLTRDGNVVAARENAWGNSNVSDWSDIVDISCLNGHSVGLCADGTVVAVGLNDDKQCDVRAWKDIAAVSVGLFCTLGVRSDGTVLRVGDCKAQPYAKTEHWKLFNQIVTLEYELEQQRQYREKADAFREQNLCQHCGGMFKKTLFGSKCVACGRLKDY